MTEQPYVDPGHRVPDDEWDKVVARAKEIREQTQAEAQGGASSGIAPVLDMTAKGIASRKYFPVSGVPTQLLVLHSAECPLAGGYAQSLTEWASTVYPADPIASWQRFIDPLVRLRFIPDELGAWHASEANPLSIGWEQAGYARYTRDQWLTPDGLTQLESLAFDMAEVAVRDGIPARWLSDQEVRAVLDGGNRSIKGFCFHRQIDPETRTDPGGGYPADLLMQRITFYMTGGTVSAQSTTITPAAEQPKEWDEMASPEEIAAIVKRVVWGGPNGTMIHNYRLGRGEYPETILGALEGRMQNEILPAVVVGPLQQQLGGLAAKVDALATALAAKPDNPLTKEEALAQLDASVKASFGEYTPVLVRNDTVPEGAPSNG